MAHFSPAGKSKLVGFVGVFLFFPSFLLLFWNEGRAVHTQKGLKEGAGAVISVKSNLVNPDNEGKLVHTSGNLSTAGPVVDDLFLVKAPDAVKLERVVEMYQWKESRSGDYYKYEKGWSPELIVSSKFKEASLHPNPAGFPYPPAQIVAKEVKMNAFRLSPGLVGQLSETEAMNLSQADLDRLPPNLKGQFSLSGGKFYSGKNPADPQVGDAQISYRIVRRPSVVSVVAMQSGDSLRSFTTRQGTTIELIAGEEKTAQEMFQQEMESNRFLTWGLRFWGFMMMFIGLRLFFGPLRALAGMIPLVGGLVRAGITIVAFLLASAFSLGTIGGAWIYYRPLLGVLLFSGTVVLIIFISFLLKKHSKSPPEAAPHRA